MVFLASYVRAIVHHRRAPVIGMSLFAIACAMWLSMWRTEAQNQPERPANAVRRLDAGARPAPANLSDRGATYHWLEETAVRATTRFADATVVTERISGGDLTTRVADVIGNEIATLTVDRLEASGDVIEFHTTGDSHVRASGRPGAHPTLEWANRQAYALWKDNAAGASVALEWQDDLIRARGARALDFDRDATEVRTEWPEGFAAAAVRSTGARKHPITGAPVHGTTLESQLTRDGAEVGRSRWYSEEHVYVWSVPGLTKGYLDADRLKEYGGWTFTPDLAWTNTQTYAFHYFHTLVATKGFVAESRSENANGWIATLVSAVAPTLYANEPGCDGLHWLDGSVFRPCCDQHDRCYEKYSCSWKSWWQWWSSWRCDLCNATAAFCMASQFPPYSQSFP